jgi:hypothetical protein
MSRGKRRRTFGSDMVGMTHTSDIRVKGLERRLKEDETEKRES